MATKISAEIDKVVKTELELYADNTANLYPAKLNVIKRMLQMLKSGNYDKAKVIQYWEAFVKFAANKYMKDFGSKGDSWVHLVNKETIKSLAEDYEALEKQKIEAGEYDHLKKIQATVAKDVSEQVELTYKGKVITAGFVDYTATDKKLYSYEIDGVKSNAKVASLDKAILLAKTKIQAVLLENDETAVLYELVKHLKIADEDVEDFKDSFEYDTDSQRGKFEYDGITYEFILTEEQAIRLAQDELVDMWESDSGTRTMSFLKDYIYITDTDKRLIANEDADAYVADLSSREVIKEAMEKGYGDEYEVEDEDDLDVEEVREWLASKLSDEKEEEMDNDLIQYFSEIYTEEQLLEANFIHVDYEKAAEDAVALDGWEHTLSRYDGNYEETKNGIVYFRES